MTTIPEEWIAKPLGDGCRISDGANSIAVIVDGKVYSSHTGGGKQPILDLAVKRNLPVIIAWHGQWRTDMFTLPAKEAMRRFKEPTPKAEWR